MIALFHFSMEKEKLISSLYPVLAALLWATFDQLTPYLVEGVSKNSSVPLYGPTWKEEAAFPCLLLHGHKFLAVNLLACGGHFYFIFTRSVIY